MIFAARKNVDDDNLPIVFAVTETAFPELGSAITHLRDVLGEATYESLAGKGATMTTATTATYAYDQIDQARTTVEHPS